MKCIKIFGPPGCGKTHQLMSIMEQELKNGTDPSRIALVTFTKKGAEEAKERAIEKFDLLEGDLPYFRTLHSLAFRAMGVSLGEVMHDGHWKELFDLLGMEHTSNNHVMSGIPGKDKVGDLCNLITGLSRNKMASVDETYYQLNVELEWSRLLQFQRVLQKYKDQKGLIDFTDMLENFTDVLPVDVAIIDEAQDLSPLQWRVVDCAFANADRMYMAGDDDQAIYKWAGAEAELFRNRPGETEVLHQSYRLPEAVWELANGIVEQIHDRQPKTWNPRDEKGLVEHSKDFESLDISKGEWLLMARNKKLLSTFTKRVRELGYAYIREGKLSVNEDHLEAIEGWTTLNKGGEVCKWNARKIIELIPEASTDCKIFDKATDDTVFSLETIRKHMNVKATGAWFDVLLGISTRDRDYYREVLRHGESLKKTPRIKISTIHAAKGGESDNVVLLSDMTKRCFDEYKQFPDEMHRVFYVGVTRAKHNLYIVESKTSKKYSFPWQPSIDEREKKH